MKTQILVDEPPNNPPIEDLPLLELERKFAFDIKVTADAIVGLDAPIMANGDIAAIYLSTEEDVLAPKDFLQIIIFLENNFQGRHGTFVTYYSHILEAIIKTLGEDDCRELILKGQIGRGIFKVWYTPGNRITVTHEKRTIRIFALGNWFNKRSDKYVLDELGITKAHEIGAFGYKELAHRINNIVSPLLGVPNYSNGDLSSPTILTRKFLYADYRKFNPGTIPYEAHEFAYNCIHAPWIEMYQQGTFKDVWDYDINSAYPSEISKLIWIDSFNGEWGEVKEKGKNPTYGFYVAQIKLKKYTPSPIQLRYKDKLIAPHGEWIGYITLQEIEFIERHGLGKVDVINGWEFYAKRNIKPFARTVGIIAQLKAIAINNRGKAKDEYLSEYIYKSASARTVGKFLQRTEKLDGTWDISPTFNPIYAAIVMTNTKIRIAELLRGVKTEEAISVTVDGFLVKKQIGQYGQKGKAGDLKWSKLDKVTVAAPLITSVPHHHLPLLEQINAAPEKSQYTFELEGGRITICEALAINEFDKAVSETKDRGIVLKIGRDYKRVWNDTPIKGRHLLEEQFKSEQRDTESIMFEEQMAENIRMSRRV